MYLQSYFSFLGIKWNQEDEDIILQAYKDGRTTMSVQERKASLKEFYGELLFK